jgi:hypothetical protein
MSPHKIHLKSLKKEKSLPEGTQIFKARIRVLLDLLLFGNIAFLTASILYFSWLSFLAISFSYSAGFVLFWIFIITPISTVELTPQSITGRGPNFKKVTIPLRKVDIRVTNATLTNWRRRYLWKDIWSIDEKCVRLYRRVLGERSVAKIMTVIERYPFRETAAPPRVSENQS